MQKIPNRLIFILLLAPFLFGCATIDAGNRKIEEGKYGEAVFIFQDYLRRNPESLEARKRLGYAYLKAGFPELAESEAKKVLTMRSCDPDARLTLGMAAIYQGRLKKAKKILEKYKNPAWPEVEACVFEQIASLKKTDIGRFQPQADDSPEDPETRAVSMMNRFETAVREARERQLAVGLPEGVSFCQ